jgi:hypothetical protein
VMEGLQHFAAALFAFLDNPIIKFVLVAIGTFLLRKWPTFVNEAVPFWTLISSVVLSVLHAVVPQTGSLEAASITFGHSDMVMTGVFSGGGFLAQLINDAILPWLAGYGAQRAGDHGKVWVKGRKPAEVKGLKKENPPIPLKPFQTKIEE